MSDTFLFEDFNNQPENRWRFFADTVMGGVSAGEVTFQNESDGFARMTGRVSTDNNGGFIQFRRDIDETLPKNTSAIRLVVRGNNQRYFVHLRTYGTLLPWQYYQAGFEVTEQWQEVVLPLSSFKASGQMLRAVPKPDSVTSIGIVAYGRDHYAQIDVKEIGFQ
jgi:hypothetical protein